jgi:hypothetical protein
MVDYIYLCQDLATGAPLAELPLSCNSLPRTISSDASTTFTLDIADPRMRKLDPYTATQPGRVALFALRDGEPVWGGIIWGRSYQAATTSLKIQASTVESYWRHRFWTITRWYPGIDQWPIAGEMLLGFEPGKANTTWIRSDGTTFAGTHSITTEVDSDGAPVTVNVLPYGFTLPYTWDGAFTNGPSSGVTRNLLYRPGKNVYDALIEMMGLERGFEWTCDPVRLSDGTYGWTSRFGMPLGRFEDVTGLEWDYMQGLYDPDSGIYWPGLGSNILDYLFTEDATPSADRVVTTGAEVDAYIPVAVRGDLTLLKAGYPLLEAGPSYSDVTDTTTLASRASGDLMNAALPVNLSTWTVRADGDMGFGTWQMGDRAVFAVSDLFTPLQSDGQAGRYSVERIVGWNLIPQERGQQERVELTTNPITMASARLPRSEQRALESFNRRLDGLAVAARQGASSTVVLFSPSYVSVPNATASANGATVTITDLVLTLNGVSNQSTYVLFMPVDVYDVATGTVLLNDYTISANSNPYHAYTDVVIPLGDYEYGDRITLRATIYMTNTYSAAIPGSTYAQVQTAKLSD